MNFIKIGNKYVNLDKVTDIIFDSSNHVAVSLASNGGGESNEIDLYAEEAKALQKYLDRLSPDLITLARPMGMTIPEYEDWKRNEPEE